MSKLQEWCEPAKHLKWWTSWIGIFAGCIIMAAGFVYFINPYNIVPGGVYGASIVLHNLMPSIQVGTFGYCFDVPLLIISVLVLGSKLGSRTIVAALFTPLAMNLMSELSYPSQEALESLDPNLLLGGILNFSDHLMLTTLIGSTVIGIGCGTVVKCNATTGGSDIIGMILQKYCHIRFSTGILLVDATVVASGLVVIGFGVGNADPISEPSLHLSLYSLIAIFVTSRVIAFMLTGSKDDKLIFVISQQHMDELKEFIITDLQRSATRIKSKGLYSDGEKEMFFLVVSHKEVISVKHKIKEVDPHAFVVVTDAYDTYGEGWKTLPSRGEIQPE